MWPSVFLNPLFLLFSILTSVCFGRPSNDAITKFSVDLAWKAHMSFLRAEKAAPHWINLKNQVGADDDKFTDSIYKEIPNLITDAVMQRGAFAGGQ